MKPTDAIRETVNERLEAIYYGAHPKKLPFTPDPRLVDQVLEVMGALIAESARIAVERGEDAELERARQLLARLTQADLSDTEQTALIQQLAQFFMDSSDNLVLVSHQSNIETALGVIPKSAQVLVIEPLGDAGFRLLGTLPSD